MVFIAAVMSAYSCCSVILSMMILPLPIMDAFSSNRQILGLEQISNTSPLVYDAVKDRVLASARKRGGSRLMMSALKKKEADFSSIAVNGDRSKIVDGQEQLIDDDLAIDITTDNHDHVNGKKEKENVARNETMKIPTEDIMKNLNVVIEEQFGSLQNQTDAIVNEIENAVYSDYDELVSLNLTDLIAKTVEDIQREQERQISELQRAAERRIADAVEEIAFGESSLLGKEDPEMLSTSVKKSSSAQSEGNIPISLTRRMRSKEIMKYWRVAPFYYTIALFLRWITKVPGPRSVWLSISTLFSGSIKKRVKVSRISTAEEMQSGWKRTGEIASKGTYRRSLEIWRRSLEIWGYFASFYLKEKRITGRYNNGKSTEEEYSAAKSQLGAEVTQNLLKLGPTFIKVGQLFSTRLDLLPKEYIEQLKLLQDSVPPFSGVTAAKIIEEELGAPVEELFDTFNYTSLAAASLGQVHVATKGDQTFAVKVQRQYLNELFDVDLGQLRQLAGFADALDIQSEGGILDANCRRSWVEVYEESKRLLYEEIDYTNEMKNCDRFRKNFDQPRFSFVRAPKTYPEFSSEKVLCMEYVPGIKVTDQEKIIAAGLDPIEIGQKIAESFLEQLCRHGFFHCDQHPGNVVVEKTEEGDLRLIYYDFGMMDSFNEQFRKGLVDFLFNFYIEDDTRECCNALAVLGILRDDPNVDRIAVERVGRDFMDRFQETLKTDDSKWDDQLDEDERKRINRMRRRKLGEEFLSMNADVPFNFPPTWTFVFRAFITLDGIGKSLDPKYDMTRIAQPYIKELLDLKDGSVLKTVLLRVGKRVGLRPIDINMFITQPRRTAAVEDISKRLEKGEFKLRVRSLEVERQMDRTKIVQSNIFVVVLSGLLLNSGLSLSILASSMGSQSAGSILKLSKPISKFLFIAAGIVGAKIPFGIIKLRKLDKYLDRYGVKAR